MPTPPFSPFYDRRLSCPREIPVRVTVSAAIHTTIGVASATTRHVGASRAGFAQGLQRPRLDRRIPALAVGQQERRHARDERPCARRPFPDIGTAWAEPVADDSHRHPALVVGALLGGSIVLISASTAEDGRPSSEPLPRAVLEHGDSTLVGDAEYMVFDVGH